MPNLPRHRGPHPRDRESFAPSALPVLRLAVEEYSWLLSRGYPIDAALKLVGDHHQLLLRQRAAIARVACSDGALARRRARRKSPRELRGETLAIDGFNAIIALEVALGGGLGLIARDGTRRDLGSVQGTYRRVLETPRAIDLLLSGLAACAPARVIWYLDRPVSNSGKLALRLRSACAAIAPDWTVELVNDTDRCVSQPAQVALSADSGVLDACERWFDLAGWVIRQRVPEAWTLDFAEPEPA